MKIENKYYVLKKIYSNYFVLFDTNKTKFGFKSYNLDDKLYKYLKVNFRNKYQLINFLKKHHINYVIISGIDIVHEEKYDDNNYNWYLYNMLIKSILYEYIKGKF